MNKYCAAVLTLLLLIFTARAQDTGGAATAPTSESLEAWEWRADIPVPAPGRLRNFDFIVPPRVLDKGRPDLADLRLRDANGGEVPYALRVRHDSAEQTALAARTFNAVDREDHSAEVSLDLGENPVSHTEIQILTSGQNFRRKAKIDASDDAKSWQVLLPEVELLSFNTSGQILRVNRFRYPESRRRYIRVQVLPDPGLKDDHPKITEATVFHGIFVPGEFVTQPAQLGPYEPIRRYGSPASAWNITFDGLTVPCEALQLDVGNNDFTRDFQLEIPTTTLTGAATPLAQGQWRRQGQGEVKPLEIRFQEMRVDRLRLYVIDNRNPPLTIHAVRYTAAARQVIFSADPPPPGPLRLYVGNPNAQAPNYDFASLLPAKVDAKRIDLPGLEVTLNPEYRPPPKPFAEKHPSAIYIVLGFASAVLLILLALLAKRALARVPEPLHT